MQRPRAGGGWGGAAARGGGARQVAVPGLRVRCRPRRRCAVVGEILLARVSGIISRLLHAASAAAAVVVTPVLPHTKMQP